MFRADIGRRRSFRVHHDDRFCQTVWTRARRRDRPGGRRRAVRQLVHVAQRGPQRGHPGIAGRSVRGRRPVRRGALRRGSLRGRPIRRRGTLRGRPIRLLPVRRPGLPVKAFPGDGDDRPHDRQDMTDERRRPRRRDPPTAATDSFRSYDI